MPAFEVLGPLQISLGRMIGDITRFLVLFTLVLFAFMVGLHNLYWYYGSQTYKKEGTDKLVHTSEAFQGLPRTLYSLFWAMFGLVSVESIEIKYPTKEKGSDFAYSFPGGNHATSVVEGVGMFLFALYHVAIIIVLVNMLIAMMSHSFEEIQTDCDINWKFARTGLWMNYIDEGGTLPVPFNMIPSPKTCRYAWRWIRTLCRDDDEWRDEREDNRKQTFIKKRRDKVCHSLHIDTPHNSYSDILQRLVRRYMFKLERQKEEGKDSINVGAENILAGTTLSTENKDPPDGGKDMESLLSPPGYSKFSGGGGRQSSLETTDASTPTTGGPLRRRVSVRTNRSRHQSGMQGGQPAVQLLSIPQLDAIQRILRILDVRLQHVQSNVKDDVRMRTDVDHIRRLMSENQNALSTVVTVLSSIQEEVRRLSITVHRNQTIQLQPPSLLQQHHHSRLLMPNSSSSNAVTNNSRFGDFSARRSRDSSLSKELKTIPMFSSVDAAHV